MPIDRAASLRNAEKFLKQGKLDSAIAEYVRIVEDQPRDWNTGNALGDLYARAGKPDKAIEQFARIADGLASEGFLPKAAALYKKILKLRPDDEAALTKAAGIAAQQGLLVDARNYLKTVVERKRARGDEQGAADAEMRLGALDPSDVGARIAAAQARARGGAVHQAVADLKRIASELTEKSRTADAAAALRAAAQLAPDDVELRRELRRASLFAGDFAGAREWAAAPEDYREIAAALVAAGRSAESVDALKHGVARFSTDVDIRADLARALVASGDVAAAAEYVDGRAGDAPTALRIAEAHLAAGRIEDAVALLRQVVEADPLQREEVARVGWTLADGAPDAAFSVIGLAAGMAVEQGDFGWAAAALQEFVRRIPGHIPALLKLVEVCVDGGLERTTPAAQAQLADAYLDTGAVAEARVIAEDLARRNPAAAANRDRLRRAYEVSGVEDPVGAVAEFLDPAAVDEPFAAADVSPAASTAPGVEESGNEVVAQTAPVAAQADRDSGAEAEESGFELDAGVLDIASILSELEGPLHTAEPDHVEVDLSVALESIRPEATRLRTPDGPPGDDIDRVFARLREEAVTRRPGDVAEQELARAGALFDAGDVDAALGALLNAARSPRLAFRAASLGARICRLQGSTPLAIEWLERAASAPAPADADAHALLYELASLLESEGEGARALAIYLELQSDAGDYRDVGVRIDRLSKAQARG